MSLALLIHIMIVLVIVGLVVLLINLFIPMPDSIKSLINLIVVIGIIIWILSLYGLIDLHKLRHFKLK